MTRYYLGVDIGGTKSHGLLTDESGSAVVLKEGEGGNPDMIGFDGLARVLRDLIQAVLRDAGVRLEQVEAAGFGIAGYDWPSQAEATRTAIEATGLRAPYVFVNDGELGLLAGAQDGWGLVVEAGTGCNCRGRDRNGKEARVLGYGMKLGEWAGAIEIVAEGVNAIAREWTQRGPRTALTQAFIQKAGAAGAADFLERVALNQYRPDPSLATLVFQVAEGGDAVAAEIIRWAGRGLGDLAVGVIHQLEFEAIPFDVVTIGSLFCNQRLLHAMEEEIVRVAPHARLVQLNAPPVVGAVLLGMQRAGVDPQGRRGNMIQSTVDWIARENHPLLERLNVPAKEGPYERTDCSSE